MRGFSFFDTAIIAIISDRAMLSQYSSNSRVPARLIILPMLLPGILPLSEALDETRFESA